MSATIDALNDAQVHQAMKLFYDHMPNGLRAAPWVRASWPGGASGLAWLFAMRASRAVAAR